MKTFILAPDSFKGTLSADEVCQIESAVIRRYVPDARIHTIPMSDGGEGMVEAYLHAIGGQRITVPVTGPLGGTVDAEYGLLPDGSAVIEMASAAGLSLAAGRPDPLYASTFGVGQLLLNAASRGIRRILLGLGGSATNDCGIGMAAALGFQFFGADGCPVAPHAVNLGKICRIQEPEHLPALEVAAACDVSTPLLGPSGATYTFGPQKGADPATLDLLEAGMSRFVQVLTEHYGVSGADVAGAGAAGGMGTAVLRFLGGTLKPGIELLLDAVHFDELAGAADMVFTGEGCIDWQSAQGKVPMGVGLRCKRAGVPCIALCGSAGKGAETLYDCGIHAIFTAIQQTSTFDEIQKTGRTDLEFLTDAVLRTLFIG